MASGGLARARRAAGRAADRALVDRPGRRGAGGRDRPRDDRGRPRAAVERSRRAGRPHRRDPRLPGRDRARGADRAGDARDRHRAGRHDDADRAVPRLHRRSRRSTTSAAAARPGSRAWRRATGRPRTPGGAGCRRARCCVRRRAEHVEVVRRLWDSLGGGRGDPRRRAPPLRRPVQAAPHRLRRRALPRSAGRRSRRARRRASPSCSRPSPASGRDLVLEDLVVFLDDDAGPRRGAPRPARRAAPASGPADGRLHRHAVGARRPARGAPARPGCCRPPSRTTCARSRAGSSPSCRRGAGPPRSLRCGDAARAPRARPPPPNRYAA